MLAPGLGQLYAGRRLRAAFWFGGAVACTAGFLLWFLSEFRSSPAEAAAWFAGLFIFQVGSWVDAFFTTRGRHWRRYSRPALAAALSILFPGLGNLYACFKNWAPRILLAPVFLAPGIVILLGEALETPPTPNWPNWLVRWPMWLVAVTGGLLSLGSIAHAYTMTFRRWRRAPRLPRLSRTLMALAISAWMIGVFPWEGWIKTRAKSFKIPSSSMEPTLQIGDRICAKPVDPIRRADIVVFKPPGNPSTDYVKRVIGLPGETVRIAGRNVFIDGRKLNEPYAAYTGTATQRSEYGPFKIPEESYFMMGDNRDNSFDSRFFGPVERNRMFGRAYKRFWPPNRAGTLRETPARPSPSTDP